MVPGHNLDRNNYRVPGVAEYQMQDDHGFREAVWWLRHTGGQGQKSSSNYELIIAIYRDEEKGILG